MGTNWDGVRDVVSKPGALHIAASLRLHDRVAPEVDPITFEVSATDFFFFFFFFFPSWRMGRQL